MNEEVLDLIRDVLDHEVVDAEDVPCGMVDDLELSGAPGSALRVTGLLMGVDAWADRLPWFLPAVVKAVMGRPPARIPWSEVAVTGDRVKLKSTAEQLGLNATDRRWGRRLGRVPKS